MPLSKMLVLLAEPTQLIRVSPLLEPDGTLKNGLELADDYYLNTLSSTINSRAAAKCRLAPRDVVPKVHAWEPASSSRNAGPTLHFDWYRNTGWVINRELTLRTGRTDGSRYIDCALVAALRGKMGR
ncbi:MAG: hypothetical protein DMG68_05015 [Acidobacteria bacterium]|nr:MAG: hypothetical protein DMG68_05015 [Acidobacteriota bacterium]